MTHSELEELLGVYALDALDDEEHQAVDEHLLTCPRSSGGAGPAPRGGGLLLGNASVEGPAVAPEGLWDRITASLQDEPPALTPINRRRTKLAVLVPLGAVRPPSSSSSPCWRPRWRTWTKRSAPSALKRP